MANYNKSFNFKNGVQVDNDNFVVNSAGLVGIGTSIPGDFLDVYGSSTLRGDVTVSGLVTTTNLTVTGVSTILGSVGIGTTNITGGAFGDNSTVLNAGIVTANYFYGDGTYLSGIVGFATAGWNIVTPDGGSANQGISTTSKVGIGTTASYNKYDLVIGQDPSAVGSPSGISFAGNGGNINATGVVTATAGFVGVGSLLTSLDVDNVGYGTISNTYLPVLNNDRLPTTIDIGATGRFNSESITGAGISITGIATAGGFVGNITGNVTGNADTATTLTSSSSVNTSGIITASSGIVGAAGSFGTSIGVGTATPVGDIHVRKATQAEIQVTSDDETAIVAVGRSTLLNGYNGQFRFGHTTGSGKYSDKDSLDILNYGPGNFNFIANASLISGSPKMTWGFGEASTVDLTLTHDGKFGIGTSEPINPLHVVGVATFQTIYATSLNIDGGTSTIGFVTLTSQKVTASEFVSGNVTKVGGSIILDTGLSGTGATDARINANSYNTVGVSTFKGIEVAPEGGPSDAGVGIGTVINPATNYLRIGHGSAQFNINNNGYVGVGTVPQVAMDFSAAGITTEARSIRLPKVTTAHRDAYAGSMGAANAGTLIYNSSTNKLNFWNGSAWEAVTSS